MKQVWATEPGAGLAASAVREAVLPTGTMHLALRLSGSPLRVFADFNDKDGMAAGNAVVGGARDRYYIRDVSDPGCSVGAVLYPGAGPLLFGLPADVLAGRHTPLEDLWGREAEWLREWLAVCPLLQDRLVLLEHFLAAKVRDVVRPDPLVTFAIREWDRGRNVASVVRESGYSHRHFADRFRRAAGLGPKAWCRVERFQRALRSMGGHPAGLCDIAYEHGYSDQAHFSRDFAEFTGFSPSAYREIAPVLPNHVPVLPPAAYSR